MLPFHALCARPVLPRSITVIDARVKNTQSINLQLIEGRRMESPQDSQDKCAFCGTEKIVSSFTHQPDGKTGWVCKQDYERLEKEQLEAGKFDYMFGTEGFIT